MIHLYDYHRMEGFQKGSHHVCLQSDLSAVFLIRPRPPDQITHFNGSPVSVRISKLLPNRTTIPGVSDVSPRSESSKSWPSSSVYRKQVSGRRIQPYIHVTGHNLHDITLTIACRHVIGTKLSLYPLSPLEPVKCRVACV